MPALFFLFLFFFLFFFSISTSILERFLLFILAIARVFGYRSLLRLLPPRAVIARTLHILVGGRACFILFHPANYPLVRACIRRSDWLLAAAVTVALGAFLRGVGSKRALFFLTNPCE
jgi:hypothetical protein